MKSSIEKLCKVFFQLINKDWNFLSNRINAEIIKNIWGKDSYYKFLLNYDSQFLDGYAALEQARELIIK